MLIVELIAKIGRAFFVQGKSIKLICRELRVSLKVVRKVTDRRRPSSATNGRLNRFRRLAPGLKMNCCWRTKGKRRASA